MIPIGFEQVVPAVVASGAPVTLLIGPEGIGKAMAAKAVVEQAVAPYDARWLPSCGVGDVRDLGRFVSVASATGRKMVGLDLDGATESSQHALLKMLEEPPRGVRFVLTSSGSLLPTVRSRSEIVVCPPLSFDQVVQVLVKHHGWTVLAARPAAALSGGRVSVALEWGNVTATRMQVLGAVKALGTGDREIWTRAVKDWSPGCNELFKVWAQERITGRWTVFSPKDEYGVPVSTAREVLLRLSRMKARAKVAIHALDSLVKESAGWTTSSLA